MTLAVKRFGFIAIHAVAVFVEVAVEVVVGSTGTGQKTHIAMLRHV